MLQGQFQAINGFRFACLFREGNIEDDIFIIALIANGVCAMLRTAIASILKKANMFDVAIGTGNRALTARITNEIGYIFGEGTHAHIADVAIIPFCRKVDIF